MRVLKESVNIISKEGQLFTSKHPEFTEKIKAFEATHGEYESLKLNDDLCYFIQECFDDYPHFYETYGSIYYGFSNATTISCEDFHSQKDEITEIEYITKDNKLYIKGYVTLYGDGIKWYANASEDEEGTDVTVCAYHDFCIEIPDDVDDFEAYKDIANSEYSYEVM